MKPEVAQGRKTPNRSKCHRMGPDVQEVIKAGGYHTGEEIWNVTVLMDEEALESREPRSGAGFRFRTPHQAFLFSPPQPPPPTPSQLFKGNSISICSLHCFSQTKA